MASWRSVRLTVEDICGQAGKRAAKRRVSMIRHVPAGHGFTPFDEKLRFGGSGTAGRGLAAHPGQASAEPCELDVTVDARQCVARDAARVSVVRHPSPVRHHSFRGRRRWLVGEEEVL